MILWKIYRWASPAWWHYLLDGCEGWTNFWCRAKGHPYGVNWYSHGLEPDMRCKNCGEDLG